MFIYWLDYWLQLLDHVCMTFLSVLKLEKRILKEV